MVRCPSCGAHRDEGDDYCPVCGETLTDVHLSEATSDAWHERTGLLFVLVLLFWPAALYGVYKQKNGRRSPNRLILVGCVLMAIVWILVL